MRNTHMHMLGVRVGICGTVVCGVCEGAPQARGFLTFLLGTPFSLRLWGPYWDDAIERRLDWMNCAAVRPTSPMLPFLRPMCS